MKINTKFLGEVEIQKDEIIQFEQGILGLEEYHRYVILSLGEEMPFSILQNIDEPQIGFIVADPFSIKKDYAFDVNDEDKEMLQINSPEEVITRVIISVKTPFDKSTINLLAPIIINVNTAKGKQIVLQDSKTYPVKYPLNVIQGSVK